MYRARNAILVIIFNRPEQTAEILSVLRKVQPERLYVAADGPRPGRKGEAIKCEQCRSIFSAIDWPCEVFRRFSDVNLGSPAAIPAAIDWFFENEKAGIVLEDDCIPSESFFRYCDDLLERYENNDRVMWINGSNIGYPARTEAPTYAYSRYPIAWGWASWRRAWTEFDKEFRGEMTRIRVDGILRDSLADRSWMTRVYWKYMFEYAYSIRNWDYRWILTMLSRGGFACTPTINLVSNVGFGIEAMHEHKSDDSRGRIEAMEIHGNFSGPMVFALDHRLDDHLEGSLYRIGFLSVIKLFVAAKLPWLRNAHRRARGRPV